MRRTSWSYLGGVPYAATAALQVELREALRRGEGPERLLLLAGDIAGVVLVDVELAVHPERVRVRPQEAFDVRVTGELVELLCLERAEVLGPHLRAELHLVEVEALARPGLAEA